VIFDESAQWKWDVGSERNTEMEFTIADFPYTQMQKEWCADAEPGEHPSADILEMP
jgi:hypothetical protein